MRQSSPAYVYRFPFLWRCLDLESQWYHMQQGEHRHQQHAKLAQALGMFLLINRSSFLESNGQVLAGARLPLGPRRDAGVTSRCVEG